MSYGTMTMDGKTFVLIPEDEFKAMTQSAMPEYPAADADGNLPAVVASRVSIARNIISRREAVGISQRALAAAAKVRIETMNRIEKAKVTADTATIVKIDNALKRMEKNLT